MSRQEHTPRLDEMPDFGMEFDLDGFDVNAAFQEAMSEVVSDTELALDEKIQRMEVMVGEGTSEVYRDFVDFRQMAAQIEMMCRHDHAFGESVRGSDMLLSFVDTHSADDGHGHDSREKHSHNDDDEYEIDPLTGKKTKKKKRKGWLRFYK